MKIITYNLRYASEDDPQPWSRRRDAMVDLITDLDPDILGAEEGLDHQLTDLMAGLGDHYQLVAEHRRDNGPEENSAIIYDSRTVELIKIEHRWLSDTPDVPGSATWGNSLPRMYSLATFRQVANGSEFFAIVTHFDHAAPDAQLRSAHQLVSRIADLDPDRPLILMGDFNAGEDSRPYAVLRDAGLQDTYLSSDEQGPRMGTFNNYNTPDPDSARIDWILVNDQVRTTSARMVDCAPDGQYPSDHLPVEAVIRLD